MATDLSQFFSSLGARNTGHGEWLFPDCPYCGGKDKLYFNVHKLVGYCQKCPRTISLQNIARDLAGVPMTQMQSYIDEHAAAERATLGFQEAMVQGLLGHGIAATEGELAEIPLPKEYRSFRDGRGSVTGRKPIDYMAGRGFDLEVLMRLGVGYCLDGQYSGRVIIPFWENGRLVYWQARDYTGQVALEWKIMNPPMDTTPHGKSSVLFNIDEASQYDFMILTESWGSALSLWPYAIGLNGKSMSEVQFNKITRTKTSTIIVLLDHGAEDEAWVIAQRLSPYKRTLVASLPFGDPNEVGRSVNKKAISAAKLYSREEHIRQRVSQGFGVGASATV